MKLGAACLAIALTLRAGAAPAADQTIIDAAKKEGKVVWYTSLIVNQAVLPVKAAFEKAYPGITLEYVRNDEGPAAIRVMNEARAGKIQADLFDGVMVNAALQRAGLLAPTTLPNEADYPGEMKDKDGYWRALSLFIFTLGYNTGMVPAGEAPKTYEALLDPKWKGKMAWNPHSTAGAIGFVGNILMSRGEQNGMAYLRRLAGQNIINVDASGRAVFDQVIAGEYPIGLMMFNHHAAISARKGAPAAWLPVEPVPSGYNIVSVFKDAPHPSAAKLFFEFLLSEDGQRVLSSADYLPAMSRIPAMQAGMRPDDGGFKPMWLRPEIVEPQSAKWAGVVKEIFQ